MPQSTAEPQRRLAARRAPTRSLLSEVLLALAVATLSALATCSALYTAGAFRPHSVPPAAAER